MTALFLTIKRRPYVLLGLTGIGTILAFLSLELLVQSLPADSLFIWQLTSGIVLTGAIFYQWVLFFVRMTNVKANVILHYNTHKWVGVLSTFFFALHAVGFGYAWTHSLAIVFCLSALTGLLNREVIKYRQEWVYNLWFWTHITLSICLLPLMAVHIWVALAYEGINLTN